MSGGSVKLNIYAGTGNDGIFSADTYTSGAVAGITKSDTTITIDTNNDTKQGTYHFQSFTIPAIYTLTAMGSNKITLYATGNVAIDGTINLNGGNGANIWPVGTVAGGNGIAGGGNGYTEACEARG